MYRASLPLSPRGLAAGRRLGDHGSNEEPALAMAMASPSVDGDGLESQLFALGSPDVVRLGGRQGTGTMSVTSSSSYGGGGMPGRSFCMSDTDSMAGSLALGQDHLLRAPPDFCAASPAALPSCFRCPISQQLMEEPVLADDGRTYERARLLEQGYSGKILVNTALKDALESYLGFQARAEQHDRHWQEYIAQQEQKVVRKLMQRKQQVRVLRGALEVSRRRAEEQPDRKQAKSTASGSTTAPSSLESSELEAPSSEQGGAEVEPTWAGGRAPRPQVRAANSGKDVAPRSSTWARLCQSARPGGA